MSKAWIARRVLRIKRQSDAGAPCGEARADMVVIFRIVIDPQDLEPEIWPLREPRAQMGSDDRLELEFEIRLQPGQTGVVKVVPCAV